MIKRSTNNAFTMFQRGETSIDLDDFRATSQNTLRAQKKIHKLSQITLPGSLGPTFKPTLAKKKSKS